MIRIPGKEVDISAVSDGSGTSSERAIVFILTSLPATQRARQRYTVHSHAAPVSRIITVITMGEVNFG